MAKGKNIYPSGRDCGVGNRAKSRKGSPSEVRKVDRDVIMDIWRKNTKGLKPTRP